MPTQVAQAHVAIRDGDTVAAGAWPPAWLRAMGAGLAGAGGQAVLVGGSVRDYLLGLHPLDHDVEVFGLCPQALVTALRAWGPVKRVGRQFPSYRVARTNVDFTLARAADFAQASRFRDLTINSMGVDLVSGTFYDPRGGTTDLAARRLEASDPHFFADDPLRGLRVAYFAARLHMQPTPTLVKLCRGLDLSVVAVERQFDVWRKLLLQTQTPSTGLLFLQRTNLLRFYPECAPKGRSSADMSAAGAVLQQPCLRHVCRAVDAAARLRKSSAHDLVHMVAALLLTLHARRGAYDAGKPAGAADPDPLDQDMLPKQVAPASVAADILLTRLRAPSTLRQSVCALLNHYESAIILGGSADTKAYRRLQRQLSATGLRGSDIKRLGCAKTCSVLWHDTAADRVQSFWQRYTKLELDDPHAGDAVLGRHLLSAGLQPGPHFQEILRTCRNVQDETGWSDSRQILRRARRLLHEDAASLFTQTQRKTNSP